MLLLLSFLIFTTLESTAATDPLGWLVNLGVAGVVIVLLVTGQLRTKSEVTHLEAEIASKDKVIEAFQLQLTGHTLPALARSARIFEAIPASETALLVELRKARTEASDLASRLEVLAERSDEA